MTTTSSQRGKDSVYASFDGVGANVDANGFTSGVIGGAAKLNADDERLLQEWSLLSLNPKSDSTASPIPPAREKVQQKLTDSSSGKDSSDPFADLLTF